MTTFPRDELELVKEAVITAADAVEILVTDGIDRAMNVFN